jgi:hypothetical protein
MYVVYARVVETVVYARVVETTDLYREATRGSEMT